MNLQDEVDYTAQTREDLIARLMANQAATQAILKGYVALRSYGVDMMKLPEWLDMSLIEKAHRLKPVNALPMMIEWAARLEHAISAAKSRKTFSVAVDNTKD